MNTLDIGTVIKFRFDDGDIVGIVYERGWSDDNEEHLVSFFTQNNEQHQLDLTDSEDVRRLTVLDQNVFNDVNQIVMMDNIIDKLMDTD